jgi:adenylate cyclase
VLISENTYQLTKKFALVGEPNKVRVKGKRLPVSLYELLGTTKPRAMTVPHRETRKSPRVEVHIPCFFRRIDNKNILPQRCKGEVIDISYHGFLFISPVPLEPYSEIKIEMSLQLMGSDSTDVYAKVINAEETERGYQCSLEFTSIDMAGQQRVKQFVDNQVYRS